MLEYQAVLSQGNEALGTGQIISVEEKKGRVVTAKNFEDHLRAQNPLIPEGVGALVFNLFGKVALHFMAEGYTVPLLCDGDTLLSLYADIKLKNNLSLAEVQAIDPTVTQLTTENITQFIKPADIVVRAKAETEPKFNTRLRAAVDTVQRAGVKEVAYVARKTNQGGSTNQGGDNNGGSDPEENVLG